MTHKLLVQTDGTSGNDVILDIACPQVEGWGPHIQAITAHTLLEQKSANFQRRVVMHNDVNDGGYTQTEDPWPRPAWFAYRRLMWLLSVAPEAEIVSAERGFVILRFTASGAGIALSPEGEVYHAPYKYAYMTWVDQHAGVAYINPDGTRNGGGSFELLDLSSPDASSHAVSIVPAVSTPTGDVENGYAVVTPGWHWTGWNVAADVSSISTSFDGGGFTIITVDVAVADPVTCVAPLVLLSNAASCTILA